MEKTLMMLQQLLVFRIIPAHAGNTMETNILRVSLWAHPRARGKYEFLARLEHASGGSSPHTRGIHFLTSTAITIIHVLELTCQTFYENIEGLPYLYGKNDKKKYRRYSHEYSYHKCLLLYRNCKKV